MIPLWKAGPALACGNAFILKPSERDPSVPLRLAELFIEAGLPAGVFNVVNGDKESVDAILHDHRVKAVGFVGSTPIAQYIYETATANGKRAQCFGGAKNHAIVMPDADLDDVADQLIGAGYGSAGERCMAISVAVPVGEETADKLVEKLTERVHKLNVGRSDEKGADFGPLITQAAAGPGHRLRADRRRRGRGAGRRRPRLQGRRRRGRILHRRNAVRQGDARTCGSTRRRSSARCSRWCVPTTTRRRCGCPRRTSSATASSIFTRDGDTARDFTSRVQVGMVGVNVPIPVPIAYHTFGGWKASGFGDLNQHGPDSIKFYTKTKTVTQRWPSGLKENADHFVIPTMD